ncbi:MAG: hypothetical protein AB7G21_01750 [Dehalococcoidia bacterium]
MPTVHTSTDSLDHAPILVVLYDDAIEPDASVAPEGEVRFTVMNRGSRPHDFLVASAPAAPGERGLRVEETPLSRVGGIVPGGSADVIVALHVGRYILEAAPENDGDAATRAELTVQPASVYDTRPEL